MNKPLLVSSDNSARTREGNSARACEGEGYPVSVSLDVETLSAILDDAEQRVKALRRSLREMKRARPSSATTKPLTAMQAEVLDVLRENYPGGKPPGLLDKKWFDEIRAWCQLYRPPKDSFDQGLYPDDRTIRRALGRP